MAHVKPFYHKIKSVQIILRDQGLVSLMLLLKKRLGQVIGGNSLSDRFPVMGVYRHPDGEKISLYSGYREYLKPGHFLAHTSERGYELFFRDNGEEYVGKAGINGAMQFISFIRQNLNIEIKGKKILEVGCGDGSLAYLLAAHGASEIHGIDVEFSKFPFYAKHQEVLRKIVCELPIMKHKRIEDIEKIIRLYQLDIQTPRINEQFDLILSNSVLEHIQDLGAGFKGMHALLKPGGIMVHKFNPFFSENGGHEFCILDFPWGHVRLSPEEVENYLNTYRAWEKEKAFKIFNREFNAPRLTLDEIDTLANHAGFEIQFASEECSFHWTYNSLPSRILSQCKRTYPKITWHDLISDRVTRVFSRRK